MKTFNVSLARSYIVTIKAKNRQRAKDCAEFFIGDCSDLSTIKDKKQYKFSIEEIEPAINEAMEVEETKE